MPIGTLVAFKTFSTVNYALPRNHGIAMVTQYFTCTRNKPHNNRNAVKFPNQRSFMKK